MDRAISQAEPATYAALRMHGFGVELYGQGVLTEQARAMLRGVPTPQRWTPDFLATRPSIGRHSRPRWPDAVRKQFAFLVDSKYRDPGTGNYSVEMRSLLSAPTFGMDVFYVCSTRYGDECRDFGVAHHEQVLQGRWRPCCASCGNIFTNGRDPMRELPEHCPNQPRNRRASGTPYVLFAESGVHPLSFHVFDNLRPDFWQMLRGGG